MGLLLFFLLVVVLLVVISDGAHGQKGQCQQNGRELFHCFEAPCGLGGLYGLPLPIHIATRGTLMRDFVEEKYQDKKRLVLGTEGLGTVFPCTGRDGTLKPEPLIAGHDSRHSLHAPLADVWHYFACRDLYCYRRCRTNAKID